MGWPLWWKVSGLVDSKDKTLKEEMFSVKQLGDKIGYGNLMSWASALWRKKLYDLDCPIDGAFVLRIDKPGYDEEIYDDWVEKFTNWTYVLKEKMDGER